jgi:hypothetical protein
MEEFELKHVEFIRCIRSFDKMSLIWEQLASNATRSGYAEFARHQADIYSELHCDAKALFAKHGEPQFVIAGESSTLTTFFNAVEAFRDDELGWFKKIAGIPDDQFPFA